MKNHTSILLIFLQMVILTSCNPGPQVRFLEPQPTNKRDLNSFPRSYRGEYMSNSDSSILTINDSMMIQEWYAFSRVSKIGMKDVLDTIYLNDIVIQITNDMKIIVDVDDNLDSATIEYSRIDTLFNMGDDNYVDGMACLLRSFKGYLFLNYQYPDETWEVKLLSLDHGKLMANELIDVTAIDSLREITIVETKMDTISEKVIRYNMSPKKKEVKEILKHISTSKEFTKIE